MSSAEPIGIVTIDIMRKSVNPVAYKDMILVDDCLDCPVTAKMQKMIADITFLPAKVMMNIYLHCKEGSGMMIVDSKIYTFSKNDMVIIGIGSIVEKIEFNKGYVGMTVCCSEESSRLEGDFQIHKMFRRQIRDTHVVHLTDNQFFYNTTFYSCLRKIISDDSFILKEEAISAAITAFACFYVNSVHDPFLTSDDYEARWKKDKLLGAFVNEVSIHFDTEREISSYAKRLNVSPKHLSDVIYSNTGKRPKEIISEYVVRYAKKRLESGQYKIQEISDSLHFPNQSFFAKYYKRVTGHSPKDDLNKD